MQHTGKCNGCGLCCYINGKPCKYLMLLGNGQTKCKIYGNHIGTYLGDGYYCHNIMDVPALYDGCPYNNDKIKERLGHGSR